MKRFVAGMAVLFVTVLAVWVAFRLAPETWAVLAGIIFGLIAALPMCAIAVILLLRGQGAERHSAEPKGYPPQQPIVVLNADPNAYGNYVLPPQAPPYGYQLPPGVPYPASRPAPVRAAPPRGFVDRSQVAYRGYAPAPAPEWEGAEQWVDGDAYEVDDRAAWDAQAEPYGQWERPAPPSPRNARILGR
jgi:hypothetical protein